MNEIKIGNIKDEDLLKLLKPVGLKEDDVIISISEVQQVFGLATSRYWQLRYSTRTESPQPPKENAEVRE